MVRALRRSRLIPPAEAWESPHPLVGGVKADRFPWANHIALFSLEKNCEGTAKINRSCLKIQAHAHFWDWQKTRPCG